MKISTFFCDKKLGWNKPFPTEKDSLQTLVTVFGATDFIENSSPLNDLMQAFPQSKIVGCSTAGEIRGKLVFDDSLTVAVVQFEKTELKIAYSEIETGDESFAAGKRIAEQLSEENLRGVLVLSDGLNVNGSRLIEGINSVFPSSVVVTGGPAGDRDRFSETWILKDGIPTKNFVSAVGFYGDSVKIGHGSKGGWDIFGPERCVTKSVENCLFELDDKPALQIYKNYLGEKSSELPASGLFFPLALRENKFDKKHIVRTILSVDENSQSMTFAGNIPEGCLAQLMRANFDRLITGANEAALMTQDSTADDKEVLSIAVSCVGRRLILGERTEDELEAALAALPPQTEQIGFYSYGEISPFTNGHCDLHNQTMTLTTIFEE